MLASKYANPEAVAAASVAPKPSLSKDDSNSMRDTGVLNSTDGNAESSMPEPSASVLYQHQSSRQVSGAGDSKSVAEKNLLSRNLEAENAWADYSDNTKPLPPLPHMAELQKYQDLPEAPIILASSPGVTTPEIAPSTPQPTDPASTVPSSTLEPLSNEPRLPPPSETSSQEPVPNPISPALHTSTPKSRRSKAGKPCAIRLPTGETKTSSEYSIPLTPGEFKARIERFEKAGFDTRGFGYWKHQGIQIDIGSAQARREFPDPAEQKQEQKQRMFGVSIPDKQRWDGYVNDLMEEKLRALGVTSGDDEPAPTLSRQMSSSLFPGLPLSPPLPSSSAASQHMWQSTTPFSAPFSPAASTNNMSNGAVVSPAPSLSQQAHPSHISRQSTFVSPFHPGQNPIPVKQPWSPPHATSFSGPSRDMSPALSGDVKRTPSGFSYGAPDPNNRQTTPRGQPKSGQLSRSDNALSWRSNFQTGQAQEIHNDDDDSSEHDKALATHVDLASPKPLGHRHNISANLEREAENAQYYPGEYVNESREASPTRNPSTDGSRVRKIGHQPKPSQTSNISASSRLNIAAKEFKYEPESSHSRGFSMANDALLPNAPRAAKAADATSSVQFATAHSHQGSVSLSNLNVAAPEFKPPAQKNFAFSSSWFNFSAKKPNDGPKPAEAPRNLPNGERIPTIGSKIFGNIADIVKPSKKSKAVPIVNPNEIALPDDESDLEDDEDGRLMQSELRRKKGRFDRDGGDEVPRFAEPTPEPDPVAIPDADIDLRASPAAPSPQDDDQDTMRPRPLPLTLDYGIDMAGNVSDGSNMPWHGIESDDRLEWRDKTPNVPDDDLLSSPTIASGIEDMSSMRESRGLSPETPAAHSRAHSVRKVDDDDSFLDSSHKELDADIDYIKRDNSDFGLEEVGKSASQNGNLVPDTPQAPAVDAEHAGDTPRDPPIPLMGSSRQRDIPDRDASAVSSLEDDLQNGPFMRQSVSPVRKLNKIAEGPISDWDDMLSSGEELKIPQQTHLNDAHMAALVEGLFKRHLAPFQRQLKELTSSIKRPVSGFDKSRPLSGYEKTESDADDEDDTDNGSRLRSRGESKADKRIEQIRSAVIDAIATTQSDGFGQIEQEVKFRKAAENRADDLQRSLMLSEREITLLKESVTIAEDKTRNLEQEQHDLRHRHRHVEEELRSKTLDFTAEVAALENTLDEYRMSSTKWREEIASLQKVRAELETTVHRLKTEATDHVHEREELDGKITKIEEDLSQSNSRLMTERSTWDKKTQKQTFDFESLQAKLTEAIQGKDRLEEEVSRLSQLERDAIKRAVLLEETQNAKLKLESMVSKLNEKTIEHQTITASYEREASEAHENTKVQIERTKGLMQTDIDIANKKVDNVRADLETRLQMVQSELENVRKDNEAVRGRYEKSLNEAIASRKEALQEATDSSNTRLQEERRHFEKSLDELSTQHDRALRNAIEDKQRSETHLSSNLKLVETKASHLEDQVHHLQDRLSVAQSAAQAAAAAAQSAKSLPPLSLPTTTSKDAVSSAITTPSHLEKISPQALRESVMVLQEQLQERESRIESLESEISTIGRDTPAKLLERETEVGWLRELLGVRIDDLSDLVNSLQMEKFDRGAARNAAIRIKANLQMEQQEKDRVLHGIKPGSSAASGLPSLTDIHNFASPKAAQLTSAFNNWRKGQSPSLAGLREAANSSTPSKPPTTANRNRETSQASAPNTSRQHQENATATLKNPLAASAAANSGGKPLEVPAFLSGLMTPPASNLRRTPPTGATSGGTARPRTPIRSGNGNIAGSSGSPGSNLDPTTPPLMRKGDYDLDAELGPDRMEFEGINDEDEEEASEGATDETAERTRLEPLEDAVFASPRSG